MYTISATQSFTISFNVKDSVGPLIGFGNGVFDNVSIIQGIKTQSICRYSYIEQYNGSGQIVVNSNTIISTPLIDPNLNQLYNSTVNISNIQNKTFSDSWSGGYTINGIFDNYSPYDKNNLFVGYNNFSGYNSFATYTGNSGYDIYGNNHGYYRNNNDIHDTGTTFLNETENGLLFNPYID